MPGELYTFTDRTYDNLAKAGISPLQVLDILHGGQLVRRHIGAFLQVAGQDRYGGWLAVALMEEDDDSYTVTSARHLDDEEIAAIEHMRKDQR